jgi:mannose-6-phosphate isomerase-like protein (cupin superfamily)
VVERGIASVLIQGNLITLTERQSLIIDRLYWHQLQNRTDQDIAVFEVQYGDMCVEEDIIRI